MKKAFSLIELSIVILIIGILIAGVTQSSRLVKEFRLSSARSLTQSSPVPSIKGLLLWLESTSEAAFLSTENEDGSQITSWSETNPQKITKNNFSRVTADSDIILRNNGINGLPALYFNEENTDVLLGSLLETSVQNTFTVFIVYKLDDASSTSWRHAFCIGDISGVCFGKTGNTLNRNLSFVTIRDINAGAATTNAEIVAYSYNGNDVALYLNGTSISLTPSQTTILTPVNNLRIGQTWLGYIGEIIIFDGVLKTADRRDIEAYLGKKWGIRVN